MNSSMDTYSVQEYECVKCLLIMSQKWQSHRLWRKVAEVFRQGKLSEMENPSSLRLAAMIFYNETFWGERILVRY
jgi:hypothetical protein